MSHCPTEQMFTIIEVPATGRSRLPSICHVVEREMDKISVTDIQDDQ